MIKCDFCKNESDDPALDGWETRGWYICPADLNRMNESKILSLEKLYQDQIECSSKLRKMIDRLVIANIVSLVLTNIFTFLMCNLIK